MVLKSKCGEMLLKQGEKETQRTMAAEKKDSGFWTPGCRSLWGTVTPVAQSLYPQSKREGHCNLSLYQNRAIFSQSYLKKSAGFELQGLISGRSYLEVCILT